MPVTTAAPQQATAGKAFDSRALFSAWRCERDGVERIRLSRVGRVARVGNAATGTTTKSRVMQ